MKRFAIIVILLVSALAAVAVAANGIKKGSTIAFIRSGDNWLMESDGSNQRPFIAGIGNAFGRMSWSPDNKKLAFVRRGDISLRYPDGGGGQHKLYDLFYAYTDSTNNFWEEITETMGGQSPEFSRDGSRILFVHDRNANMVNATMPKWRLSFYDTKSFLLRDLELEPSSEVLCSVPTMSPEIMKQVAFVVTMLRDKQPSPIGIAIASMTEFPIKDDDLIARAQKMAGGTLPSWSPDGQWIAYVSNDIKNQGLLIIKPDLTGQKVLWTPPEGMGLSATPPAWSPDSKMLLFATQNGSIYKISIAGGDAVRLSGPGNDGSPAWCN
jgi:Tol biopolymer transport system component